MQHDGGERRDRTRAEAEFLIRLLADRPWLDVWLHDGPGGEPWVCVSHDFAVDGVIRDTLRLDFDGGPCKADGVPPISTGTAASARPTPTSTSTVRMG